MAKEPFDPSRIAGAAPRLPPASGGLLSVSQITALIKRAVETALPPTLSVVGQISNCKRHTSGHLYFTLKDSFSEISCVMWRSDAVRVKFKAVDGLEVVATGAVEVFERAGRYQLYVRKLEPRGVGALELAYRQLCEKLRAEGLFDPARKKPLPRFPRRIAIVTSPTGAAVADMLRTIRRKFPCVNVLIHPVRVQGGGAAAEIAAAIGRINADSERLGGIDVIIVGRGGGSLEDLWAFNEEVVARAIFASRVPIISGVGHETDISISDLAADVRAATPTAAAELAVPDRGEVLAGVAGLSQRLVRASGGRIRLGKVALDGLLYRRPLREPLILVRHRVQRTDDVAYRMQRAMARRMQGLRRRIDAGETTVRRISPHAYLLRTGIRLRDAAYRLRWAMSCRLAVLNRALAGAAGRLARAPSMTRLPRARQRTEQIAFTMPVGLRHRLAISKGRVDSVEALLRAVSHEHVLARGFSITRTKKGRRLVRSIKEIADGDRLMTQVADGEFESETVNVRQLRLFE